MAAPSEYNIEVESILGGLESALARGQPLEKAMSSFRNAGYKEENIKEALKKFQVLHRRSFSELAITPPSPKKIVGAVPSSSEGAVQTAVPQGKEKIISDREEIQKPKSLVTAQTREKLIEQYEREKLQMESKKPHSQRREQDEVRISYGDEPDEVMDQELEQEEARLERTAEEAPLAPDERSLVKRDRKLKRSSKEKKISSRSSGTGSSSRAYYEKPQVVSGYGDDAVSASENFRAAVDEMIKSLSRLAVPTPQAPQIIRERNQKPQVINKISNYGMKPPTPVNKAVTFLLIFLLILLLGVLAAVFFFREELIDLFNTFTLEYLLPML